MKKRQYSHAWKGGSSFVRGLDWPDQRIKCLVRDGYKCRSCGKKNKRLSVHHKIDWVKTKDNRLNNLITVCQSCHTKIHKFGAKKGNNFGSLSRTKFKKGMTPWNKGKHTGNQYTNKRKIIK